MEDVRKKLEFPRGGMWENEEWAIEFDVEVSSDSACKHCSEPYFVERKNSYDGATYKTGYVRCPRVIVAWNEGGHNSTGVCLDCVLESVAEKNLHKGESIEA